MDIRMLQKPKDEPFKTGGGGLLGLAILIAMIAIALILVIIRYAQQ